MRDHVIDRHEHSLAARHGTTEVDEHVSNRKCGHAVRRGEDHARCDQRAGAHDPQRSTAGDRRCHQGDGRGIRRINRAHRHRAALARGGALGRAARHQGERTDHARDQMPLLQFELAA